MARINKAIELLEQGQAIYYTGGHTGAELTYEGGKRMAKTWADYINIGMEHGCFDMSGLDAFMKGLVDGGPTNSGHRTPTVIVEAPVAGTSEAVIEANAWQFQQILARGVHGVLLCNAETPEAVKAFVEACRYPFHSIGVGHGLDQGKRGNAGQVSAAPSWGITPQEYLEKADVWPLNPQGELLLGIKVENRCALTNVHATARVPGIAFAESGPGDMSFSFGYKSRPTNPIPPELEEARNRIFDACKASGIVFLESVPPEGVGAAIEEGVRIFSAGSAEGQKIAEAGRAYMNRTMPV
jgi:4-hydroxy-2-oxoheptanedioate aldolase